MPRHGTSFWVWLLAAGLTLTAPLARADRTEALTRVSQAEQERTTSVVRSALADPDRGVRRRAALAAGRLADPQLSVALVPLLADPEPAVRAAAAFAAGLTRADATRPGLEALLRDPDASLRGRAAEALGRLAPRTTAEVLATHLEGLLPPGPRVSVRDEAAPGQPDPWLEARLTLFALAPQQDEAPILHTLLPPAGPRTDWWPAVWLASRFESRRLLPVLQAGATSASAASRVAAAAGLGRDDEATLRRLLADPVPAVVTAALRGLAVSGTREASVAALPLLRAERAAHRAEALRVLAAGPALPELASRVLPALADDDPETRAAAHQALARLDPDGYPLTLSGLDADPEPLVRAAIARSIQAIGGEFAAARIPAFLGDPEPAVRTAAGAPGRAGAAAEPVPAARRPLADHLAATAPYQPLLAGQIYSPRVILETTMGRIELLLDPVEAPLATADFIALARQGHYDGAALRGASADLEIQFGPWPGPGAPLPAERNLHAISRGALVAAGPDGGFSIALAPRPDRDGTATVFGTVTVGLDVADRLRPHDRIRSITIWDGR